VDYLKAFLVGGLICVIGQVLIDRTKLTPGRILVVFVVIGAVLGGIGWYENIVQFAGAGATVPIVGFGYVLSQGVIRGVSESGFVGVFTGGLRAVAGGLTAALLFGFLAALVFNPKAKT